MERKRHNLKIGFCSGVWDIFHQGHKNFLAYAMKHCDYLIVGVATDWCVRVQKGMDRPYEMYDKRVKNVQHWCNKVVRIDTFDLDIYVDMCDVWFKGEDQHYTRPFKSDKIVKIKRTEGISSTRLIEELRHGKRAGK